MSDTPRRSRRTQFRPRTCPECGKKTFSHATFRYQKSVECAGHTLEIDIPDFYALRCGDCGEIGLDGPANDQLTDALCVARGLLTAAQIQEGLDHLGATQTAFAEATGISQETLSRWVTRHVTQSASMDRYMRILFEYPEFFVKLQMNERLRQRFAAEAEAENT